MQKNGFTKKMIINSTISLIIIIGIVYFVIIPSSQDIKSSKNKIEEIRINLEKKYIAGQNLREMSENIKTIETELPKLNQMFIKKSDAIGFVTSLENIAIATDVKQGINLTDGKGEDYQKNSLRLFVNGNFFNQINYLNKLETIKYYINIKSMEITKGSTMGDVSMQIFSDTYWIND